MPRAARCGGAVTADKNAVTVSADLMLEILLLVKNLQKSMLTKSDLRTAVSTILRGDDMNVAKPGPRLTPAKRRQIEVVEEYRATHRGCSLYNACIRSFVPSNGGYKSAKTIYEHIRRHPDTLIFQ